ncbi:MAG TPA: WG repeat-containing protein [Flavobacteriales bacterium]|nr:WG repeat-containing protein [Flavobacteriales bacterium]
MGIPRSGLMALFVFIGLNSTGQTGTCFTAKEKALFDAINKTRIESGLTAYAYSYYLTLGAVKQVERIKNDPGSTYIQLQEYVSGYTGYAVPFDYTMSSLYNTPESVIEGLFQFPEIKDQFFDKGNYAFVSMGLCIDQKQVFIYLGAEADQSQSITQCDEPDASKLPYIWLREPTLHATKFFEAEGTIAVSDGNGWGFMDTTGKIVVACRYAGVTWFAKGLACVIDENDRAALVNHKNEIAFPFGKFRMIQLDEKCSRMIVEDNTLQNFLADLQGNVLTKGYEEINFSENDVYSFYEKNKKGVMDANGKILLPAKYGEISGLSEGLYSFAQGGKWGFMDENFNVVIQPKYGGNVYYGFAWGLSHFEINEKVGFMDTMGKIIIPAVFDEAGLFNEQGYTHASLNGKFGVIDRSGKFIVPATYDRIERSSKNDYWVTLSNGLYGILGNNNQWKLNPEFEEMYFLNNNRYLVRVDGSWGMIKINF